MLPRLAVLAFATAAATTGLAACDDDPGSPVTELPDPLVLDGRYQLASTLDIQASAALPAQLVEGIELLRGLRDEPGETLFELADRAGVPAVDTIHDALPEALESRLNGWIDSHVDGVLRANPDLAAGIDLAITAADTVLAQVDIESELEVRLGSAPQHRLSAIAFDAAGTAIRFDVAGQPLTTAAVDVRINVSTAGSQLAIGDHSFGLPIGTLAYRAFDAELVRRTGHDLRGLLAVAFECPALAADVADKCVLNVCVGHEDDLEDLCEAGLDYLAAELRTRFTEADLDVLRLRAGTAVMVDANNDLIAETLAAGEWSAWLDAGMGPRPAPAVFAGSLR